MLAGATLLLHRRVTRLAFTLLRRLASRARGEAAALLLDAVHPAAGGALRLLGLYAAGAVLAFPSSAAFSAWYHGALTGLLRIGVIVYVTWGASRCVTPEVLAALLPSGSNEAMDKTFRLFSSRILRLLVLAFGAVIVIAELGYDVGGLIAGIGLGGLTIALAAQDWASNLFGGLVILLDKPFAVDDWISLEGSMEGIVEDITFRSTRIRTFDHAQVVVPNSLLASKPITNWSRMQKRKISFDVGLCYASPPDKLRACTARIEAFLRAQEPIDPEVISVTFNELSDSALKLRVHFFTRLTGYADYMKVKEQVHYEICAAVDALELSFAFPTRTVYVKENPT